MKLRVADRKHQQDSIFMQDSGKKKLFWIITDEFEPPECCLISEFPWPTFFQPETEIPFAKQDPFDVILTMLDLAAGQGFIIYKLHPDLIQTCRQNQVHLCCNFYFSPEGMNKKRRQYRSFFLTFLSSPLKSP